MKVAVFPSWLLNQYIQNAICYCSEITHEQADMAQEYVQPLFLVSFTRTYLYASITRQIYPIEYEGDSNIYFARLFHVSIGSSEVTHELLHLDPVTSYIRVRFPPGTRVGGIPLPEVLNISFEIDPAFAFIKYKNNLRNHAVFPIFISLEGQVDRTCLSIWSDAYLDHKSNCLENQLFHYLNQEFGGPCAFGEDYGVPL